MHRCVCMRAYVDICGIVFCKCASMHAPVEYVCNVALMVLCVYAKYSTVDMHAVHVVWFVLCTHLSM